MNIFVLDDETLNDGRSTFRDYLAGAICGPAARNEHDRAMSRWGGVPLIPGVIDAMIEQGIHDHDAIVHGAARVTRCRRSTVREVIEAMTASVDCSHRWQLAGGKLSIREEAFAGAVPRYLIAA